MFRYGISEREFRIRGLTSKLQLPFKTNQVYCFLCRHQFENPNGNNYPSFCINCFHPFTNNDRGIFCLPDFVIDHDDQKGILYVDSHDADDDRARKKVRNQVRELKAGNYKIFVIDNDEVDAMHNATLIAFLKSVYLAVKDDSFYKAMYGNEKEYSCLRN